MATIPFTDTLSCTASHGRLALATQIYDTYLGQSQAKFNRDITSLLNSHINSDVHFHLGTFERSGLAEDYAKEYELSGSAGTLIMDYKVKSDSDPNIRTGLILQNVGRQRTLQLLVWDNTLYYRYITFTSTDRNNIDPSQTTTWAPCFVNSISYTPSTRLLKLWWNNIGVAECTLPLATNDTDGLLSAADHASILSRLQAVEDKLNISKD